MNNALKNKLNIAFEYKANTLEKNLFNLTKEFETMSIQKSNLQLNIEEIENLLEWKKRKIF